MNLCPITLREANDFVAAFHRHNGRTSRDGGKFAVGVEEGSELFGVAIVGRPLARMLDDDFTAEVLRVCVRPDAPKNASSMLYAACWRAWRSMGGRRLVTYTLTSEAGASLRGAGFKLVAEVKGHKGGWASTGRDRQWQPIYGQQKLRWEAA